MNCWPAVHEHNRHRTVAGIAVNLLLREFSISTSRVDFHEYSDATPVINTLSCPRNFCAMPTHFWRVRSIDNTYLHGLATCPYTTNTGKLSLLTMAAASRSSCTPFLALLAETRRRHTLRSKLEQRQSGN